jgi:hypothetical protein
MGGVRPNYRLSGRFYTRYILAQSPNAKICILYQDDDFGRDYTAGVRDVLGERYAATVKRPMSSRITRLIRRLSNSEPAAVMR